MKNVLSHKQMHQLNIWVEGVGPSEFDMYTVACDTATKCLGFKVTYSNLKSSEDATGISLVRVKEVKVKEEKADSASTMMMNRICGLEEATKELRDQLAIFSQWCRVPIPERLKDAYIKPSANKPLFCQENG